MNNAYNFNLYIKGNCLLRAHFQAPVFQWLQSHNFVLSSFMTYPQVCSQSNMKGTTSKAGSVYNSDCDFYVGPEYVNEYII
jgi:hypothetical protein